jgi:hypothetical protein
MHVLNDMQEHCEFDKCFWCRYFTDLVQSGVDLPGGGEMCRGSAPLLALIKGVQGGDLSKPIWKGNYKNDLCNSQARLQTSALT